VEKKRIIGKGGLRRRKLGVAEPQKTKIFTPSLRMV
jgi:hypothetical protein